MASEETTRHGIRGLLPWLIQLPPPTIGVAYFVTRVATGRPLGPVATAGLAVCGLWLLLLVVPLAMPRGRAWLRAHVRELWFLTASVVVAVAIMDVGLSLLGIVPTIADLRRQSLLYETATPTYSRHRLVPGHTVARVPPIQINSRGIRGPEIAPSHTGTRVLFLGGSHVFDFDGGGWPHRTGQILNERGHNVDVVNGAQPGHQTADSLVKFATDLWLTRPDIVVVVHAWNDIKYFGLLDFDRPLQDVVAPHAPDWRLFPSGLDRLLCASSLYRLVRGRLIEDSAQSEGDIPAHRSIEPGDLGLEQYRLNLRAICSLCSAIGARGVLVKQARLPIRDLDPGLKSRVKYYMVRLEHDALVDAFHMCDDALETVAREVDASLLDMHAELSGRGAYFRDHIHFTVEGSEQAAQVMANLLEPMLE